MIPPRIYRLDLFNTNDRRSDYNVSIGRCPKYISFIGQYLYSFIRAARTWLNLTILKNELTLGNYPVHPPSLCQPDASSLQPVPLSLPNSFSQDQYSSTPAQQQQQNHRNKICASFFFKMSWASEGRAGTAWLKYAQMPH